MTARKVVEDMSGFCRHSGLHHLCGWGAGYDTPSCVIICSCECHATARQVNGHGAKVLAPKGPRVAAKVLTPKS